jgi:hypothetical protein
VLNKNPSVRHHHPHSLIAQFQFLFISLSVSLYICLSLFLPYLLVSLSIYLSHFLCLSLSGLFACLGLTFSVCIYLSFDVWFIFQSYWRFLSSYPPSTCLLVCRSLFVSIYFVSFPSVFPVCYWDYLSTVSFFLAIYLKLTDTSRANKNFYFEFC